MATITGIKAGTTRITASYGGKSAYVDITVQAIAPSLSFTKTSSAITYNRDRKAIGTVSYNGDGTAYYLVIKSTTQPSTPAANATTGTGWVSVSNGGTVYATNSGVNTDAGKYWVFLKADAKSGGGNYTAVSPKANSNWYKDVDQKTVTLSWTNTTHTYDGSAKSLTCTVGNVCTGDSCSANLSTNSLTAPGELTVTANSLSNSNYKLPSTGTSAKLTVNKYTPTVTLSATDRIYNGSALYATASIALPKTGAQAYTGTIYYGTTSGATTYNKTYSSGVGLNSVSVTNYNNGSGNTATVYAYFVPDSSCSAYYNNSGNASKTMTITGKANQNAPTATGASSQYATSGSITGSASGGGGQGTLMYKSDANGGTSYGTATSTAPSRAKNSIGTTTFVAYWAGNGNYNASGNSNQASLVVSKADQAAPTATGASVTYPSTATATASGGGGQGTLSWTNGSSRSAIGSQTTKAYWAGNSNYNASGYSNEVTLAVAKYTPTVTLTATNRIYNGSALYATATVSVPSGGKTMKGTIYYGSSESSQTNTVAYSGSAVNLTSVSVTNYNGGSGNSITVYAHFVPDSTCNDVYNESGNVNKTMTITGPASQSAPTATGNLSTYSTSGSITGSATGGGGHGTLYYKADTNGGTSYGSAATSVSRSRSSVGTTTFVAYWGGDGNYSASGNSNQASLVIDKATQSAPTVTSTSVTYNATATGSASGGGGVGTLYYKADTNGGTNYGSATTTAPSRSAIGTTKYVAYWGGNGNYYPSSDSAAGSLAVAKYTPTVTLTATNRAYNGNPLYATATVSSPSGGKTPYGTIYYGTSSGATTYTVAYNGSAVNLSSVSVTNYNRGSNNSATVYAYFVPASSGTNACNDVYNNSGNASKTMTITGPASRSGVVKGKNDATHVTYGSTLEMQVTGNTENGTINWSVTNGTGKATINSSGVLSATQAGTVTVSASVEATANYAAYTPTSVPITVDKADQAAPTATGASVTYNSTATASASGGGGYGTLTWTNGSSRSAVGSQDTYAYWSGDTNHNASPNSNKVTLSVAKYTPTVTLTATSRAYNGNPLYASATVSSPSGGKTPNGTIYYGTTSGATTYSVAYSGSSVNLTNVSVTNDNDSTTVYAYFVPASSGTNACNDVYNNSGNASKSFSINAKAASTLPTNWRGDSKVFHQTASLTATGYSGGTLKYRYDVDNGTNWTETTTAPTRTAVGITAVQCMVVGDSNHSNSNWSSTVTLTITKAGDATMQVDTFNRTYTGAEQVIAQQKSGSAEGIGSYTFGYYKNSTAATAESQITWITANNSLKVTNAGKYHIYYKFSPDGSHSNSNVPDSGFTTATYVASVDVDKATITPTVSMSGYTYGGTKSSPSVSGNPGNGTVTYYYNTTNSNSGGTAWSTVTSSTSLNAGTYYMYATVGETSNYYGATTATKSFTIAKAAGTITYTNYASKSIYCTDNAVVANKTDSQKSIQIANASASNATGTVEYSSSTGWEISSNGLVIYVPSNTPAGTYNVNVTATSKPSTNYNEKSVTNTIVITINQNVLDHLEMTVPNQTISFNGTTSVTVIAHYSNTAHTDVTTNSGTTYSTTVANIINVTDRGSATFDDGGDA